LALTPRRFASALAIAPFTLAAAPSRFALALLVVGVLCLLTWGFLAAVLCLFASALAPALASALALASASASASAVVLWLLTG